MDAIQALRASLANKQVSDEDCFMRLESHALGFHAHLREGMVTQQFQQCLPGRIQQGLPPHHFPVSVALAAYPAVFVIYSPEQLSEVERSS